MTHLVLVEDNELNRDMLIRRLVRRGYTVTWAGDGLEGVEAVKRERPAVVLMDLGLPVMDGWEATRALKANPETAGIPVIALTAHALSTDRDAAMEAGCDEYETKPVELDRLIEKIEALRAKAGA